MLRWLVEISFELRKFMPCTMKRLQNITLLVASLRLHDYYMTDECVKSVGNECMKIDAKDAR